MKGKLIGLGAITSLAVLCLMAIVLGMSGEFFSAVNFQILVFVLVVTIVMMGSYLLSAFSPQTSSKIKLAIGAVGTVLIVFGGLVSFNIIDILTTYNWLIAIGICYILLVQLQLMQWGHSASLISKICSFIVILANLFLIVFFVVLWRYSEISIVIDIAVVATIVAFLIGVIANKKVVEPA
jgi:hypothetical protein